MYPVDKIKDAHPIDVYLRRAGIQVSDGEKPTCLCPFHDDHNPSMSIRLEKKDWRCWTCGIGGSVIDLHMRLKSLSIKEAIKDLAEQAHIEDDHLGGRWKSATYQYKDETGKTLMMVDRIEEGLTKRFAQYTEKDGERINNVKDVKRVLYRLERWHDKKEVSLCEGEKCVEALESIGLDATTNAGGSNGWIDAYSFYLKDKHVDIWPDNDKGGGTWLESVLASLKGNVASLRILRVPAVYNDIADILTAQGDEIGRETIERIRTETRRIPKGIDVPILSAGDMFAMYKRRVMSDETGIDLSRWLPSLRYAIRPLLPGDLAVVLSDTGVGKTTILSNIAYSQRPIPVLLFELELMPEDMCERFMAMDNQLPGTIIDREVRRGTKFEIAQWSHVYVCPLSKVTIETMEDIINKAELYIGKRPSLVLVDYIGLMSGGTGKRYERMSTIAEGLKTMAKTTNTVIILSSQIHRDKERGSDINLHDAKDSGSIEASAQLVIGAFRPDQNTINLKILKCTKSLAGKIIECSFDGDKQTIKEL
jgi:hypothetical protein